MWQSYLHFLHTAAWLLKSTTTYSLTLPVSLPLSLSYLPSIYHIPPFDQCQGHVWSEPVCLGVCEWDYGSVIMCTVCLCSERVCLCVCIPDWPCFDLPCSAVFELKSCVWQGLVLKQWGPSVDKAGFLRATCRSVKLYSSSVTVMGLLPYIQTKLFN